MRVLADENMPGLEYWIKAGHDLAVLPGRDINAAALSDVDVLLVRSVTRVDQALLGQSNVRFVGTATSGMDHIDREYLKQADIEFSIAAGANARSVTDYVFSVLAVLCVDHGVEWMQKRIGIIGGGNVGGLLCRQLADVGVNVALHDPFLGEDNENSDYLCDLDTVLACDLLTLHTSLTNSGPHPTQNMIDEAVLKRFSDEQFLINTARGEVIDTSALLRRLLNKSLKVVLDVWEGEPAINTGLADQTIIATPHIAGYSADSKIRATYMLFDAFNQWAENTAVDAFAYEQSKTSLLSYTDANRKSTLCSQLSSMILQAYDVREDDRRFRQELKDCRDQFEVGHCFDWQRKHYPERREFTAFQVAGGESDMALRNALQALGFTL